jgi:hypothetical protein
MKKLCLILMTLCLIPGLVLAKDYQVTKKAGAYEVTVSIDKNPPVVGKNVMTVGIRDAKGMIVSDAKVSVEYVMPAMPGMPAMNYKTGTDFKKENYTALLNFSMSGAWNVQLKISRGGKTDTVKLNVDVR